jgi:hypothetical protein
MPRIFQITKEYDVIANPEAVKLVPELAALSRDELRYVIYVADYVDSPFRRKPVDERKNLAINRIWKGKKKIKDVETSKVVIALREYEGLIFDIRRRTIDIYKSKVEKLHSESLREDITFSRMKDVHSQIEFLQDKIMEFERELDHEEDEDIRLKGDKNLSTIEIWQRRQQMMRKFYTEE